MENMNAGANSQLFSNGSASNINYWIECLVLNKAERGELVRAIDLNGFMEAAGNLSGENALHLLSGMKPEYKLLLLKELSVMGSGGEPFVQSLLTDVAQTSFNPGLLRAARLSASRVEQLYQQAVPSEDGRLFEAAAGALRLEQDTEPVLPERRATRSLSRFFDQSEMPGF